MKMVQSKTSTKILPLQELSVKTAIVPFSSSLNTSTNQINETNETNETNEIEKSINNQLNPIPLKNENNINQQLNENKTPKLSFESIVPMASLQRKNSLLRLENIGKRRTGLGIEEASAAGSLSRNSRIFKKSGDDLYELDDSDNNDDTYHNSNIINTTNNNNNNNNSLNTFSNGKKIIVYGHHSNYMNKIIQFCQNYLVISINSNFRQWWDLIIAFLTMYLSIVLPIRIGFNVDPEGFWNIFEKFADLLFILETIFNFFTTYIEKATKEEVFSIRKIQINYIVGWFLIDSCSSIPVSFISNNNNDNNGQFLIFMKLLRIFKIFRILKLSESVLVQKITRTLSRRINPSLLTIIKLTATFIFIQHLMACMYWFIIIWQNLPTPWCPPNILLIDTNWLHQYAHAFYWSLLVTTANNVSPSTPVENIFTTFMLLVGLITNAVIIGSAANLLANMDKIAKKRKADQETIDEFMRFRKIPMDVQNKINQFYDYKWIRGNNGGGFTSRQEVDELFLDLPDRLRFQLHMTIRKEFMNKVSLFKACSIAGVASIIQNLKPLIVMPKDVIIAENEQGTEFYFINRGSVSIDVIVENMPILLGTLAEGSFFGEIALLNTEKKRSANVRANMFCELEVLGLDDFEKIYTEFPPFQRAISKIAETRMQTVKNMQRMGKSRLRKNGTWKDSNVSKNDINMDTSKSIKTKFWSNILKKPNKLNDNNDQNGTQQNIILETGIDNTEIEKLSLVTAAGIVQAGGISEMKLQF